MKIVTDLQNQEKRILDNIWQKVWQYNDYRLWQLRQDDKYIYNVTKTDMPPQNNAGYFSVWAVLTNKNIPIFSREVREAINKIIENSI